MLEIITNFIRKQKGSQIIVGFSAPQGSGKSFIASELSRSYPSLVSLSLDDFYYPSQVLYDLRTTTRNPLYEFRGNPGTHDLDLLVDTIKALQSDSFPVHIPKYDKSLNKGRGDRCSKNEWSVVNFKPDVILVEGWCVGFKAFDTHQLDSVYKNGKFEHLLMYNQKHIIALNDALKMYEESMFSLFDSMIALSIPNTDIIYTWRYEQEVKSNSNMLSKQEVDAFIDRFMPSYELYYQNLIGTGYNSKPFLDIKVDNARKMIGYSIK